ncbi:MAG: hypothetical protein OXE85_02735 [Roseovarius sp.]|nr:hypothetical protein [Roseovarius sp.]
MIKPAAIPVVAFRCVFSIFIRFIANRTAALDSQGDGIPESVPPCQRRNPFSCKGIPFVFFHQKVGMDVQIAGTTHHEPQTGTTWIPLIRKALENTRQALHIENRGLPLRSARNGMSLDERGRADDKNIFSFASLHAWLRAN